MPSQKVQKPPLASMRKGGAWPQPFVVLRLITPAW